MEFKMFSAGFFRYGNEDINNKDRMKERNPNLI
jgi:hypothetical protein